MNNEEAWLPEGKTCADCAHCSRCVALFGVDKENVACDFIPPRFQGRKLDIPEVCHDDPYEVHKQIRG